MHELPRNWVVYRLSALGDVILATGALRHWHESLGWRFHVVVKKAFAPVYDHMPFVDRVVALEDGELRMPRLVARFAALADEYNGWGFVDLHGTTRSALLRSLWKGPTRRYAKFSLARRVFLAGRGLFYRKLLQNTNVPQRYAMAIDDAPPPPSRLVPAVYLTEQEKEWGKSFLAKLSGVDVLNTSACVALHPFAAHPHKAWPREHYKALCGLLDSAGVSWTLIGRGEALFPDDPRDLTNKTSLRESAAILAACSALVSGDSGPMHLATATGTPVVGLFGPTTKEWGFFPSGPRDRVLEKKLSCRPCSLHGNKACAYGCECLSGILPEEVMAVLLKIVAEA